ncbi:MAG: ABC transporter permease [Vulcanimicrobiaceae bacterium]
MTELLRCIGGVIRRDARLAATQPLAFATRWFAPIITIAGFYFVSKLLDPHHALATGGRTTGYFSYVAVNVAFMLLQTSAILAFAQTVRLDQIIGTLEAIVAAPRRTSLYVAACGVWPIALSVAQVAVSLAAASAFMGLDLRATNPWSLLAFGALSTVTMASIGILSAAAVIAFKAVPPTGYLVGGAASLLAGTLFPVTLLPPPLRAISWLLPLTHSLRGFRGAVAGESLGALSGEAWWLLAAMLILFPLSFFVLERVVERGRRDGTLSQY